MKRKTTEATLSDLGFLPKKLYTEEGGSESVRWFKEWFGKGK